MLRKTAIAVVVALAGTTAADAAEIKGLVSTAVKAALEELMPAFERTTGHSLHFSYGPSGGVARRLLAGEAADLMILDSIGLDVLIKDGKVAPGRIDFARTGIAIAVKKGAPKPDVSTPEALKRALLAAKSVGHTAPAGGGITALHIQRMFVKLGIDKELEGKIKLAAGGPSGRVSVLVSSGEAEIGIQQASELLSNPDVEVIGMLPPEFQQTTIYAASLTTSAKQPDAAKALIRALATPEAMALYKTKGLER
jgi:molybdate transport system substrate-binding protein